MKTHKPSTKSGKKLYNPNWPFPQYDEKGKQLFPDGWNKRRLKPKIDFSLCEEALF